MKRFFMLWFVQAILIVSVKSQETINETRPQAWAGNSVNAVIFRKNALVTHGDIQFIAYYHPEGYLCLAKRKLNDEQWEIRQTQYTGNIRDAHNSISIMTDGEGYLHVSWNHHDNPLNYVRSLSPLSLDLSAKQAMTAVSEENVTYPEFYKLPDGNLIFLYRDGQSGKGNLAMNRYNVQTKQWQRLHDNLIDGEGQRSAYWQACVDATGTIHLSWVWRETPDVASNHDMCYACSRDNGQTWENAQGEKYRLPITAATAEYVCHIPQNSELINQTSMTADNAGNPYIATYFREQDSDIPQYHVICKDGGKWTTLNAGFRKTTFFLKGGGTKAIPVSRPQIVVNETEGKKQIVLIFRDEERRKKVSIATCTDIQGNRWSVGNLTEYSVGEWEPTYDTELWKEKRILQLYVQEVRQIDGEGISDMTARPVSVLTVSPEIPEWKLVWSDEFNIDGKPDSAAWTYERGFVRNQELQWYQPDNAVCKDGVLILSGRKERISNPGYLPGSDDWRKNRQYAEYTASSIKTVGKKEFQYGRFEVRAKIPTASGSWPAIWTLGNSMSWPSCGEIDIMEYYRINGIPHILANTAWGTDAPHRAKWDAVKIPFSKFTAKDSDWASKFHVWRMDWDETAIRLYLDDELLNETLLSETVNSVAGNYSNPFRQPHYILLNLAIGGDNGGAPDNAAFPLKYEIDYVRVYQKK